MRSLVKLALVGAALAGANAHADVINTSSGNGELVLFVRDVNNSARVYARGLGITMNDVLAQSTVISGPYNGPVQRLPFGLRLLGATPS